MEGFFNLFWEGCIFLVLKIAATFEGSGFLGNIVSKSLGNGWNRQNPLPTSWVAPKIILEFRVAGFGLKNSRRFPAA